jgi:hypothetical protein
MIYLRRRAVKGKKMLALRRLCVGSPCDLLVIIRMGIRRCTLSIYTKFKRLCSVYDMSAGLVLFALIKVVCENVHHYSNGQWCSICLKPSGSSKPSRQPYFRR